MNANAELIAKETKELQNGQPEAKAPGWFRRFWQNLKQTLPTTGIFALLWLVLGWLRSFGIHSALLFPLNFLTGALAGLDGGSFWGGTIGKTLVLLMVNSFLRTFFARKGTKKEKAEGALKAFWTAAIRQIPQYFNVKQLVTGEPWRVAYNGIGMGLAFMGYAFLTGSGSLENSFVCVLLFASSFGNLVKQRGVIITLVNRILKLFTRKSVNRDTVNRLVGGNALGNFLAVVWAALRDGAGIAFWLGLGLFTASVIFLVVRGIRSRKLRKAAAGAAAFLLLAASLLPLGTVTAFGAPYDDMYQVTLTEQYDGVWSVGGTVTNVYGQKKGQGVALQRNMGSDRTLLNLAIDNTILENNTFLYGGAFYLEGKYYAAETVEENLYFRDLEFLPQNGISAQYNFRWEGVYRLKEMESAKALVDDRYLLTSADYTDGTLYIQATGQTEKPLEGVLYDEDGEGAEYIFTLADMLLGEGVETTFQYSFNQVSWKDMTVYAYSNSAPVSESIFLYIRDSAWIAVSGEATGPNLFVPGEGGGFDGEGGFDDSETAGDRDSHEPVDPLEVPASAAVAGAAAAVIGSAAAAAGSAAGAASIGAAGAAGASAAGAAGSAAGSAAAEGVSGAALEGLTDVISAGGAEPLDPADPAEGEPADSIGSYGMIINGGAPALNLCNTAKTTVVVPVAIEEGSHLDWTWTALAVVPDAPKAAVATIIGLTGGMAEASILISGSALPKKKVSIFLEVNAFARENGTLVTASGLLEFPLYEKGLLAEIADERHPGDPEKPESYAIKLVEDSNLDGEAEIKTLQPGQYEASLQETEGGRKLVFTALPPYSGSCSVNL